jgi:hypothetical protein
MPAARRLSAQQITDRRARWRRWRSRSLAGVAIAPTPFSSDTVDVLFRLGYLNSEFPTPKEVGVAIAAALATLRD